MKKIICKNNSGNQVVFTYAHPFWLDDKNTSGFSEVTGNVSTVKSAFGIGTIYVGTSVNERNIIIVGTIRKTDIVKNRNQLYKIFPLGEVGTLYYYEGDEERKINYYVKDLKFVNNTLVYKFQLALVCPNPYFTDLEETSVSLADWDKKFKFPLSIPQETGIQFALKNTNSMVTIENDTNIEVGMHVVFTANDVVINPTLINVNTQEKLTVNITINAGDSVVVTTYRNNKNIILISNGIKTNINNYLLYGTKFLQIHSGTNIFKYDAETGSENMVTEIAYYINYEAV